MEIKTATNLQTDYSTVHSEFARILIKKNLRTEGLQRCRTLMNGRALRQIEIKMLAYWSKSFTDTSQLTPKI